MRKCIVFLLALAVLTGLSACKTPTARDAQETIATTEATVLPTEPANTEPTAATAESSEKDTGGMGTVPEAETSALPTEASAATATAQDPTQLPPTAAPTEISTAEAPAEPTAESTEAPTEEPHSDFYVDGVTADQMVAYFNEVVLNMEYTTGDGDAAVVQKWEHPISYRIEGVPSHKDAQTISAISKQLNGVEGFPGIRAATGLEQNVTIYFLHDEEFEKKFAHILNGENADGAVQFWYYNNANDIYSGRIGYRKDAEQSVRDSVIPEEIINLLGISDTTMRKDSITYQYGSEVTEPSAVDWAIIKLLYNPAIKSGMNADQCEAVIRQLYY